MYLFVESVSMRHSVLFICPVLLFHFLTWDLAEWSERCASIPKITGLNPSGDSEITFRSDLLLTV
jgi:hypothetical protein